MIGIMELTEIVLWTRCDCPIHRQGRRRIMFCLNYGMTRARLLRFAEEMLKEKAQSIAEYAVMLGVIIVIIIGVIHLVGVRSNEVFSQIGSKLQ